MKKGQRTDKADDTRQQIMNAALELFCRRGYAQTTMRDIAERASLSVGATYYHFETKEDLVFAFYADTHREAEMEAARSLAAHGNLRDRVEALIRFKLRQLEPYRPFIDVLAHKAIDPTHPLSPFSKETGEFRSQAIGLFTDAIAASGVRVASPLQPYLPELFWAYQLSITLYWIHDRSPGTRNTDALIAYSLTLVSKLLQAAKLPLMGGPQRALVKVIEIIKRVAAE